MTLYDKNIIQQKTLNVFYYTCSYAKVDYSRFMNTTVRIALNLIPDSLQTQPVFETDFTFSNEKIGDYYTGVRRVLTKIFGNREILAYVTATEKEHGTKRPFFSTVSPENLQIFCAWQEKAPLNQTGSDRMKYIPLLLYSFRWNIETSYYEQKTFWSFCNYMLRNCKGIEMLVNLINISYCAMKILPYQNEHFSEYRTKSVQKFRFELSQGLRSQIFFATFMKNIETHIKSNAMTKALKQLIHQQVYHL